MNCEKEGIYIKNRKKYFDFVMELMRFKDFDLYLIKVS